MLNLKLSARWKREDGQFIELDQRLMQTLKTIDSEGSISLACKAPMLARFSGPIDQGKRMKLTLAEHLRDEMLERKASSAWAGGRIDILDWRRLADIAEFDPTYLRLQSEPV